jgi:hypothetical protein
MNLALAAVARNSKDVVGLPPIFIDNRRLTRRVQVEPHSRETPVRQDGTVGYEQKPSFDVLVPVAHNVVENFNNQGFDHAHSQFQCP